jgi:peptide-methionine (S)-S-oxide reductase
VGRSYRSAIFPQSAAQKALAASFIQQLRARGSQIATKIENGPFYPAEAFHQDFARRHPTYPYIVVNDAPKVAKLKRTYPQLWKA